MELHRIWILPWNFNGQHLNGIKRKSKFYKKYKQKTAYKVVSWFVTMHLVMIGLLIFSEKPYEFIIKLLSK